MTFQVKRSFVSIAASTIVFLLYFFFVMKRFFLEDGTNDTVFWAVAILLFAPIAGVTRAMVQLIFSTLNKLAQLDPEPRKADELDIIIGLRSAVVALFIFVAGFFIGIIALAAGLPLYSFFIIVIAGGFLSGISVEIAKIILYRKGF